MAKQLYAIQLGDSGFHSGGSKTGANVALYDEAGANRILGRYKKYHPDARKVPVAFSVTQEQLADLQDDSFKLNCLEGAGVDNWSGYDWAMEAYHGENQDE